MNSKRIKLALIVTLFLTLSIYHISSYFFKRTFGNAVNDYYDLFHIVRLTVGAAFAFFVFSNKYLFYLVDKKNFIHGTYEGEGYKYKKLTDKLKKNLPPQENDKQMEFFSIRQNLMRTTISGRSFRKNTNELVSTWTGNLFMVHENIYFFGILLNIESPEYGILKIQIDRGCVNGFFFSANPVVDSVYTIIAQKI